MITDDYRNLPTNPLKDLLIFEERIQHNISSLRRLRNYALYRVTGAGLTSLGLFYLHGLVVSDYPWTSVFLLICGCLFAVLFIGFLLHTIYTDRLALLPRYRLQCEKLLRLYNLELTERREQTHYNGCGEGPWLRVRRNSNGKKLQSMATPARISDLLDAYRWENWHRKQQQQ